MYTYIIHRYYALYRQKFFWNIHSSFSSSYCNMFFIVYEYLSVKCRDRSFFHLVPPWQQFFFSAERRDPSGDTAAVGDDKQKVIVVAVVLNAAVVCCDLGKSTWNLKIICLKRKIFSQTFILGFHVNFQRCVWSVRCGFLLGENHRYAGDFFVFVWQKRCWRNSTKLFVFECHRTISSYLGGDENQENCVPKMIQRVRRFPSLDIVESPNSWYNIQDMIFVSGFLKNIVVEGIHQKKRYMPGDSK